MALPQVKGQLYLLLLLVSFYFVGAAENIKPRDGNYQQMLSLLKGTTTVGDDVGGNRMRLYRLVSSHVQSVLWQVDKLQTLDYGGKCDSLAPEKARHELTDLVANVTQSPSLALIGEIDKKEEEIVGKGVAMCDYSRGLACDPKALKCACYTGHRHADIVYEPVREGGACKLDEMSRCYSPSYLVSRGALVIHCINGAKCVGDLSGRRCVAPIMTENCHCQKPCPDGSFTNLLDELKKCIKKLSEISVLQFNESCVSKDQVERDDVIQVLETSGSEKAGPIIRSIKHLLASNRSLCSPQDQLVCHSDLKTCSCGPQKDGLLYQRENDTCLWAKGSRCFPEDIYANVTGWNGSCISSTQCLMEGQVLPCDPNFEEPLCYCQDPSDLETSGILVFFGVVLLLVGGVALVAFLVHAKFISCPGTSPANV